MKKLQMSPGASMRQSQTMPQLSYTREDIQEQYLSRQASLSKRARAQSSDPKLRYKQRRVELSSGSELEENENDPSGFETRNESGRRSGRKRRRRANSASHLFSGCFSLPHLTSTLRLHHNSNQQHQFGAQHQQRRSILAHLGLVSSSNLHPTNTTTLQATSKSVALPASQTAGNLHSMTQARKHVSFGSAQSPVPPATSCLESMSMSQGSRIEPLPITQQPKLKSKPVILRNYEAHQTATDLASKQQQQPLPNNQQLQSPPIYLVSQVANISGPRKQAQDVAAASSLLGGSHHQPPQPPHLPPHQHQHQHQPPPPRPMFRRPTVPVRTQATQTEITAYHLMASPPLSSSASSSAMRMITAVEATPPHQQQQPKRLLSTEGAADNEASLQQIAASYCSSGAEPYADSEWSAGDPAPEKCHRDWKGSEEEPSQKVAPKSDTNSLVSQEQVASFGSYRTESDASASIMMRDSDQPVAQSAREVSKCRGSGGSEQLVESICTAEQEPQLSTSNTQVQLLEEKDSQEHLVTEKEEHNSSRVANELELDNELAYIEPPSQFKEEPQEVSDDSDTATPKPDDDAPRAASPDLLSYSEASSQTESMMLHQIGTGAESMGFGDATKPAEVRRDNFLTLELVADSLRPIEKALEREESFVKEVDDEERVTEEEEEEEDGKSVGIVMRMKKKGNSNRPSTSSTLSTRHHSYCSNDDFQQQQHPKSLDVADGSGGGSGVFGALGLDNRSGSVEEGDEEEGEWSGCKTLEGDWPLAADASSAQKAPLEVEGGGGGGREEEETHDVDGLDLGQASLSIGGAQSEAANGSVKGEGGATIKLDCLGFMMAGGHVLPEAPTCCQEERGEAGEEEAASRVVGQPSSELGDNHELAERMRLFRGTTSSSSSAAESPSLSSASESGNPATQGANTQLDAQPDKWPLCDLDRFSGATKSNNSTPTTVSELECDEELSTPSFVDTYRSKLIQLRQLADSVLDQVLGELLEEPSNGSQPASSSEQIKPLIEFRPSPLISPQTTTTTTTASKRPEIPKKPAHLRQKQEVPSRDPPEQVEAATAALAVATTSLATAAAAAALALQSTNNQQATTELGKREEARTLAPQSEASSASSEPRPCENPEVGQVAPAVAHTSLAPHSAPNTQTTGNQTVRRRSSLELSTVSEEPSEEVNDDDELATNCCQLQQNQSLFVATTTPASSQPPHPDSSRAATNLGPQLSYDQTLEAASNSLTEPQPASYTTPIESQLISRQNSISTHTNPHNLQQQRLEAELPEELASLAKTASGDSSFVGPQEREQWRPCLSASATISLASAATTTTATSSPSISNKPLPHSPPHSTQASSSKSKTRPLIHDDTLETLEADIEVEGLLEDIPTEIASHLEEAANVAPSPNFSLSRESPLLIDLEERNHELENSSNKLEEEEQEEMDDIEEESSVSISQQGVLVTTETPSRQNSSHNSQQQQASTFSLERTHSSATPTPSPHRKPPTKTGSSESATAAILEHLSRHHDRTELHLDEPSPALEQSHSVADCHQQRELISEQKSNPSSRSSAGSSQADNASSTTGTIKRNSQQRVQQHPSATIETIGTSLDLSSGHEPVLVDQQLADSSQQQQRRGPPLSKLKSTNTPVQHGSVEGSICSSCSCMEQPAAEETFGPTTTTSAAATTTTTTTTTVSSTAASGVQRAGSTWMSQEEGTVFTENYWMSHWLYISEHEECETWRRSIEGTRQDGSSSDQEQHINANDALLECMPEVSSTSSEKDFSNKYKSTTRKMIHRRAAIEMYKRIANNNLRREKRVEINRSKGEFGFRIHGSRPVVVSAIERGTSAEHCGLLVGDLIYAINGTNILDMAHSDVVRLAHSVDSSSLVLDLVPTSDFLKTNKYSKASNRRYEPTLTGHLMRLSPSTAQPLLVELQEQMANGPQVSPQRRAVRLNEVMRLAWRRRYFVLRSDNCLYWYKTPQDIEPCGGINLQGFSAALTSEFREPSYIIRMVKYGSQPHYLGTDSMCDIQVWIDAINKAATEANQNDPYMRRTLKLARTKPNLIPEPDCAGYLYKYSQKRSGGAHWRPAYFVLKDACLYVFREQQAELVEQASAVYYLHGYKVRHRYIEQKKHIFELISPRETVRPMFLMASSEIDCRRWIAALEYSIERWIEIG